MLSRRTDEFLTDANQTLAVYYINKVGGLGYANSVPPELGKKKAVAFLKYGATKCSNVRDIKDSKYMLKLFSNLNEPPELHIFVCVK